MRKKRILCGVILLALFIIFTVAVKTVDVGKVGENSILVGFSTVNGFLAKAFPYNEIFHKLSDYVGYSAFIICAIYGTIGLIQLIARKDVLKVDKEILLLGFLYVITLILKVVFDIFVINYRPVLIGGELKASYPSSHTFMALIVCGSSVVINKKKFNNAFTKVTNYICFILGIIIIVTRILAGVHWMSDIVGSVLLSFALILLYSGIITNKDNQNSI